jgi:hypothetical protein
VRKYLKFSKSSHPNKYPIQTIEDNVRLFTPAILNKINEVVVKSGHTLEKKTDNIEGRCDSFVVETDVHYPTDINLLFDAMRKIIVLVARPCESTSLLDWRHYIIVLKKIKRMYRHAQQAKRARIRTTARDDRREREVQRTHRRYNRKEYP